MTKKTNPRQAQHLCKTNTVSTKPVRHHFGKVSTEEVRQGSSRRGFWEGVTLTLVELRHVGSEESASLLRGDLITPPEAGAGGAGGVGVCSKPSRMRREGKVHGSPTCRGLGPHPF